MKRLISAAFALLAIAFSAQAATLSPITLLNPAGSTAGQAIVSTGPSTAPAWSKVTATALAAQAANTVVANVTGSSASPTAFAMPSCSTTNSALQYTSGTGFTCYANSAVTTGTLAQFAATTSAQLAGVLSDETGTGSAVFSASPALTGTPTAPTASLGTNTTQIATMAAVQAAVQNTPKPYFQAHLSANQSVTANTATKIQFNTKDFDSGGYFDATTNYRFTPLVAGKYKVTLTVISNSVPAAGNNYFAGITKNGASLYAGVCTAQGTASNYCTLTLSDIVTFNGSTDYIETSVTVPGTSTIVLGTAGNTTFEAYYLGP